MEVQQRQTVIAGLKKHIRKKDFGELENCLAEATDESFEKLKNLQFKSRAAVILLCIFLGGIGAGRLYLRDYGIARKRILATLIFDLILPFVISFAIIMVCILFITAIGNRPDDYVVIPILTVLTFLGFLLQAALSALAVAIVSLILKAWYIEEIYNCYYDCSKRNLQCIKSCVNACYASERLKAISQNSSINIDKIKAEQKELCQNKFSATKKFKSRLNDVQTYPWDLLTANDNKTFQNLDELKLKSKAVVAWLSILLGIVCAGRFYLGDRKAGIIKIAVTFAIYILSIVVFFIPYYVGVILCFLGNMAIFIWYIMEIPKCIKLCVQINSNRINACISRSLNRKTL